ncbi:hypothetical protein PHYC_01724 [Phycisphaerales bacterium]|nr:hypothetical protein PHYC_01724 [Phycisphaerales bacterium]
MSTISSPPAEGMASGLDSLEAARDAARRRRSRCIGLALLAIPVGSGLAIAAAYWLPKSIGGNVAFGIGIAAACWLGLLGSFGFAADAREHQINKEMDSLAEGVDFGTFDAPVPARGVFGDHGFEVHADGSIDAVNVRSGRAIRASQLGWLVLALVLLALAAWIGTYDWPRGAQRWEFNDFRAAAGLAAAAILGALMIYVAMQPRTLGWQLRAGARDFAVLRTALVFRTQVASHRLDEIASFVASEGHVYAVLQGGEKLLLITPGEIAADRRGQVLEFHQKRAQRHAGLTGWQARRMVNLLSGVAELDRSTDE